MVAMTRRCLTISLLCSILALASAQTDFTQMRDLIARGYYNSAAQLNGPELIHEYPDRSDAHYLFARALYLTGDYANARVELDRAMSLADSDASAEYAHLNGLLRATEGDVEGALRALRNAWVRSSDYMHAMDWGRTAWQFGEYEQALDAFTAAAGAPEGGTELWPHLNRGRILLFLEQPQESIEAFLKAIDVFEAVDPGGARPPSPGYVEAFYRLGQAYEALGQIEKAETNYRAARSTDPNYTPAAAALDRISRRAP